MSDRDTVVAGRLSTAEAFVRTFVKETHGETVVMASTEPIGDEDPPETFEVTAETADGETHTHEVTVREASA